MFEHAITYVVLYHESWVFHYIKEMDIRSCPHFYLCDEWLDPHYGMALECGLSVQGKHKSGEYLGNAPFMDESNINIVLYTMIWARD